MQKNEPKISAGVRAFNVWIFYPQSGLQCPEKTTWKRVCSRLADSGFRMHNPPAVGRWLSGVFCPNV